MLRLFDIRYEKIDKKIQNIDFINVIKVLLTSSFVIIMFLFY